MEAKQIEREVIIDLREQVEDLLLKLESIELASDPEFMASLKKSKEEISKSDVASFDEL
ncbi:MAG: hypothetical protein KKB79_02105 [Nanoarchaeota archaeon]|nr:hypothetical protein [Nanoarchaeota archaeon]